MSKRKNGACHVCFCPRGSMNYVLGRSRDNWASSDQSHRISVARHRWIYPIHGSNVEPVENPFHERRESPPTKRLIDG